MGQRSRTHIPFIVTSSRTFSAVSSVVDSLIPCSTNVREITPRLMSTAVQLSPQFNIRVAKVFAAQFPSRLRSTHKHAAGGLQLAAEHERWIKLSIIYGQTTTSQEHGDWVHHLKRHQETWSDNHLPRHDGCMATSARRDCHSPSAPIKTSRQNHSSLLSDYVSLLPGP